MRNHNFFASLVAAALLLSPTAGLPASPHSSDAGQYSGGGATSESSGADSPGPPGASGSLRGPAALRGYNPSNPLSLQSTVIPPEDFELSPGQSLDPKLGVYLDLSKVKNPQPIRGGTTASTDPGPRESLSFLFCSSTRFQCTLIWTQAKGFLQERRPMIG